MASAIPLNRQLCASLILVLALVPLTLCYATLAKRDTVGQDVYYIWVEGKRILDGENPYDRILQGNMRDNDKYPTYFPVYYLLSALTQAAGLRDYNAWIIFWRIIFDAFHVAIGLLIFIIFRFHRMIFLGVFGALFWWFNRWSLEVIRLTQTDLVPLFFLLLSLYWFERRQNISLVLFGLSLGLKQIGIFMLPIYLIWVWQREASVKRVLFGLLLISSIPLVASAPFLVWGPEGFARSILFSATRRSVNHFRVPAVDVRFGWVGFPARIPMLVLLLMLYVGVWQQAIRRFTAALLTMAVFIAFNPVLFVQYLVWAVPFFPLTICDYAQTERSRT